ncbi:hypothetical protein CLAFUW4_04076 [Fulvia fulva]|nr:hypothetical protein CLAFUR4_04062 [Fulvia fulva]WPV14163.1 hypothetical protein CLAFUW4_04076 [Fulvia fulva]WPV29049.1 hypothetical protein CLAFUW7_04065 [Fulvia fulva]
MKSVAHGEKNIRNVEPDTRPIHFWPYEKLDDRTHEATAMNRATVTPSQSTGPAEETQEEWFRRVHAEGVRKYGVDLTMAKETADATPHQTTELSSSEQVTVPSQTSPSVAAQHRDGFSSSAQEPPAIPGSLADVLEPGDIQSSAGAAVDSSPVEGDVSQHLTSTDAETTAEEYSTVDRNNRSKHFQSAEKTRLSDPIRNRFAALTKRKLGGDKKGQRANEESEATEPQAKKAKLNKNKGAPSTASEKAMTQQREGKHTTITDPFRQLTSGPNHNAGNEFTSPGRVSR